ncbi:CvpA family protein [Anaplasma bovis]|uniref:CvpA family protein n=1 Tax=Anaplasma bovis TaxID=186733 RepID=UPI002FF428BD
MFLDIVVVAIVLFFVVLGFCRGFIKELLGIIGLVATFMLTSRHHDAFFDMYISRVGSGILAGILSGITVFVCVIICVMLINSFAIRILDPIRHNALDRMAGSIVGVMKSLALSYVLFCVIETFVYVFAPYPEGVTEIEEVRLPAWFADTYVYNVFSVASEYVGGVVPEPVYEKVSVIVRELLEKKHSVHGAENGDGVINTL